MACRWGWRGGLCTTLPEQRRFNPRLQQRLCYRYGYTYIVYLYICIHTEWPAGGVGEVVSARRFQNSGKRTGRGSAAVPWYI